MNVNILNLKKIKKSIIYSFIGIKELYKNELSFKQELFTFIILIPLIFFIGSNNMEYILLFTSLFNILIIESINSAIETTINRISLKYNKLSQKSKNIGSASVFLSILNFIIIWSTILICNFS